MKDNQLRCDCCKKIFNVMTQHKAFTWDYNEYGLEQVFCVTCSKKRLSDARGWTKQEALIPQHPPKIRINQRLQTNLSQPSVQPLDPLSSDRRQIM